MADFYNNYTNLFSISKTLRFELIPQGKTKDYFLEKILDNDELKNEKFKVVKKYCDEYHKHFIEECLCNIDAEKFIPLLKEYEKYFNIKNRDNKQDEEFKKIKENLRKEIVKSFSSNKKYNSLFSKDFIKEILIDFYKNDENALKDIEIFKDFTTFFTGYHENRKNMYSVEEKHTAISFRLINENLPIFINNNKILTEFIEKMPELSKNIKENLNKDINEYFFDITNFTNLLTQSKINEYNEIIGGHGKSDNKVKGINEYINLYCQNNKIKIPKLKILYKQILSDKGTNSFKFDIIESDKDVIDRINNYYENFNKYFINEKDFEKTISNINNFNLDKIFIDNDDTITTFSQKFYGNWSYITNLLTNEYNSSKSNKKKKDNKDYDEEIKKYLKSIKQLSIQKIIDLIDTYEEDTNIKNINISEVFSKEYLEIKNNIKVAYSEYLKISNKDYSNNSNEFLKDDNIIETIKNLLDSIKSLQSLIKILIPKDNTLDIDKLFYDKLNYELLAEIIPLYNKVRNYLTKKPFSTEKIKLTFDCGTLLNGWDVNKESNNLGVLFRKDNNYYLGIMDKKNKKLFTEYNYNKNATSYYEKIDYKLLPGPNKMLPKVFFSKKGMLEFKPSLDLKSKYDKGYYKKGNDFDINFCHSLIDFYKTSINKHKDWSKFDFKFSDTKNYEDISQFYREVEHQGYKISFKDIASEYIDNLVNEGKLYLFQIYNKDFSSYSKGNPNLHTIYWKALFDEDNLKNIVYKLNGEAEVFYRKKSIEAKITHKKNVPIKNKKISREKKESIFNYDLIKKESIFNYDLIKDKRYTVDKFLFHVPITLNFKSSNSTKLNDKVLSTIKDSNDLHIIGIDRGERHLLYYSVINMKGEIIKQHSLNVVNKDDFETNYHDLLKDKEKKRKNERLSWKNIENIKELKDGYMSQVVNEIVKLIFKYNAIVVLEDLNAGFKNSRKKIEKQVYDKFETKLINKLSYIVNKKAENKFSQGGFLNAYQLANEEIKAYKQNGAIFYIPAWNTSKIDPLTGFVDLFNKDKINYNFISNFESIKFNKDEDYFEFYFDYSKFSDRSSGIRQKWTLCTYGDRIINYKDNNEWKYIYINLTEEFKNLFLKFNINFNDKEINLKEAILNNSNPKFFSGIFNKDGFYGFAILFKSLVRLRNSESGTDNDFILSPVKNKSGIFFDSRKFGDKYPENADANGAYNIARKGLMIVEKIKREEEEKNKNTKLFAITNHDWLSYVQEKDK